MEGREEHGAAGLRARKVRRLRTEDQELARTEMHDPGISFLILHMK